MERGGYLKKIIIYPTAHDYRDASMLQCFNYTLRIASNYIINNNIEWVGTTFKLMKTKAHLKRIIRHLAMAITKIQNS
jgi:hypothetical protein